VTKIIIIIIIQLKLNTILLLVSLSLVFTNLNSLFGREKTLFYNERNSIIVDIRIYIYILGAIKKMFNYNIKYESTFILL